MSHLDEGQLGALLDDELTPEEKRAVEAHLADCADCRALWEETRALAAEADRLVSTVEVPPAAKSRPAFPGMSPVSAASRALPYRTLAWAASVVLAVGLGYSLRSVARAPVTAAESAAPTAANQPLLAERADKATASSPVAPSTAPAARRSEAPVTADLATGKSAPTDNAAPPAAAPKPASPAATGGVAFEQDAGTASLGRRTAEARDARALAAPARTTFRQVEMAEAVRTLAGSIRLVDGLEPVRVLIASGSQVANADPNREVVRVVYEDPPGRELWLDQQRVTPESESARVRPNDAMLPGDTLVGHGEAGSQSVRWLDQHGFLLVLTGYLSSDSLRAVVPRVR